MQKYFSFFTVLLLAHCSQEISSYRENPPPPKNTIQSQLLQEPLKDIEDSKDNPQYHSISDEPLKDELIEPDSDPKDQKFNYWQLLWLTPIAAGILVLENILNPEIPASAKTAISEVIQSKSHPSTLKETAEYEAQIQELISLSKIFNRDTYTLLQDELLKTDFNAISQEALELLADKHLYLYSKVGAVLSTNLPQKTFCQLFLFNQLYADNLYYKNINNFTTPQEKVNFTINFMKQNIFHLFTLLNILDGLENRFEKTHKYSIIKTRRMLHAALKKNFQHSKLEWLKEKLSDLSSEEELAELYPSNINDDLFKFMNQLAGNVE